MVLIIMEGMCDQQDVYSDILMIHVHVLVCEMVLCPRLSCKTFMFYTCHDIRDNTDIVCHKYDWEIIYTMHLLL